MHAERALHSNPCLVSSISHVFVFGVQIRTIGHTGEGDCICTRDEQGDLEIDDECPVRGHSAPVNSVAFSPDGTRVVSASGHEVSCDNTVRIWDVASGKEVGASGPGHARY